MTIKPAKTLALGLFEAHYCTWFESRTKKKNAACALVVVEGKSHAFSSEMSTPRVYASQETIDSLGCTTRLKNCDNLVADDAHSDQSMASRNWWATSKQKPRSWLKCLNPCSVQISFRPDATFAAAIFAQSLEILPESTGNGKWEEFFPILRLTLARKAKPMKDSLWNARMENFTQLSVLIGSVDVQLSFSNPRHISGESRNAFFQSGRRTQATSGTWGKARENSARWETGWPSQWQLKVTKLKAWILVAINSWTTSTKWPHRHTKVTINESRIGDDASGPQANAVLRLSAARSTVQGWLRLVWNLLMSLKVLPSYYDS